MLILPLPARPDWSRPPWVTLGLILACIVVFLLQGSDGERLHAALENYRESRLPATELPAYVADLEGRGKQREADTLGRALAAGQEGQVFRAMEMDPGFMNRLRAGQVIRASDPGYSLWRAQRERYEALRAQVFTERFSLQSAHPTALTLVTHMFLHADLMHLAGNMALLFIVGYTVEASLGAAGFALLYLLGGLAAAVPDLVFGGERGGYSLGASGAISAVMAAYVVLFGLRRVRFFYWFFVFFDTARWPALVILPVWLGKELLERFVFDPNGRVNYLAHAGGLIAGAALTGLYRLRRGGKSAEHVLKIDADEARAKLLEQAGAHVARLQFERAAQDYARALAQGADDAVCGSYLRVARLARKPELIADAAAHLLRRAAERDSALSGDQIAAALADLGSSPPPLALAAWALIARRLIDARELAAAETLILRLASRDGKGHCVPGLLLALARGWRLAGQTAQAERAEALLARRFPGA